MHSPQGFDNDDGSSGYIIHDNFIYGEGLKQDYGGHNSLYFDNVNIVHQYDGQVRAVVLYAVSVVWLTIHSGIAYDSCYMWLTIHSPEELLQLLAVR